MSGCFLIPQKSLSGGPGWLSWEVGGVLFSLSFLLVSGPRLSPGCSPEKCWACSPVVLIPCHFWLPSIIRKLMESGKSISESEVAQSVDSLDPTHCSPPGSSVHGIFQASILEWVAISFSRGSSRPRDRTWVSHTAGRCFTLWATNDKKKKSMILF